MKRELSPTEMQVAEQYCHGLVDKEISERLEKPIWTIRNHKRHIYQKLGISTTHEIVLWMVCRTLGKEWDIRELRLRGLSAVLSMLILFMSLNWNPDCTYRRGARKATTSMRVRPLRFSRLRTRKWS